MEEPEAPMDGGSQQPPHSVWCPVAAVLMVEDWVAVDWPPDSLQKASQAVSSHLLDKVAGAAAGIMGWIFLLPGRWTWTVPSVTLPKCMSCRDRRRSEGIVYACWSERCVALRNSVPRTSR